MLRSKSRESKFRVQASGFRLQASGLKLMACVVLLVACSLQLAACGYTTRSMITSKFKTIHIAAFANKIDITKDTDVANKYRIYRPALETDVTKAVINKYLFDGNLRPVKEEAADLLLKGELVSYRKDPIRYTDSDEVEEYRINISVNISLWNKKEDKLVWQENNFTGDATYYTSFAPANVVKKSEDATVNDAVNDLARRIVERTVEEW